MDAAPVCANALDPSPSTRTSASHRLATRSAVVTHSVRLQEIGAILYLARGGVKPAPRHQWPPWLWGTVQVAVAVCTLSARSLAVAVIV